MCNLPYREGLEVTDDVSIVEHLKHPVYITEGSYTNIKVAKTSPYTFSRGYFMAFFWVNNYAKPCNL